jgi:hypothetical protein
MRQLVLLPAILLSSVSLADDPKPTLTLEADFKKQGRVGEELAVRLVNTGREPILVATNKLRLRAIEGDKKITLALDLTAKTLDKDRLVVPAADTLGIVKLLPGEVARVPVVLYKQPPPIRKALDKLDGKTTLAVSYEVSAFWGKRFGIWHGKISATPTVK